MTTQTTKENIVIQTTTESGVTMEQKQPANLNRSDKKDVVVSAINLLAALMTKGYLG